MARTVMLDLREGQTVWCQSHARYVASEYTEVKSVGRLWAVLGNGHRANRYTGVVDGGKGYISPATVYRSKEDFEREEALYESWRKLKADLYHLCDLKDGVTRRDLLKVRRLLRLDE